MSLPMTRLAAAPHTSALALFAAELRTYEDSESLLGRLAAELQQRFDASISLFSRPVDGGLFSGRTLLADLMDEDVPAGPDSLVARAANSGHPCRTHSRHGAYRPVACGLRRSEIRSAMAFPLPHTGGAQRVIQLLRREDFPFSSDDADWCALAAELTGSQLSRQRVEDELELRVAARTHALEEVNRQLQEDGRRRDTFLANLTGDLRLPLADLNRHLALLETGSADQLPRLLQALQLDALALQALVDRLLAQSRNALAVNHLTLRRLDINEVVADGVRQQRPLADRLGRQLLFLPALNLPGVAGDDNQLVTAFADIIGYAVADSTGRRIEVRTQLDETDQVHVTIRLDGGVGCNQAPNRDGGVDRRRYTEASAIPDRSLRLATVREIIGLHGGSVTMPDQSDGARLFVVTLPLSGANRP